MPLLRFHVLGDWEASRVRTIWTRGNHDVPAEVRALVERAWERAASRPGVKLFDGPMCRLESWAADDRGLELVLSPTSYKLFMGTNLSHPELADQHGPAVLANPVGVSPALETADGFLMLGRRNARVAYYPSRVHPFAGCLEPVDGTGSASAASEPGPAAGPDVFAAVRRELAEELAFTDADIADVRCTGIAEDTALRQPELIFRVTSHRTRREIESQVARDEHSASLALQATSAGIVPALTDPLLTPVAVASLLLWGRVVLGPAWFDAHAPLVSDRAEH